MFTRLWEPDRMRDTLRISHAQPVEWIDRELLEGAPDAAIPPPYLQVAGDRRDVVMLSDDYGHRYIYRLGEYDAARDAFRMEWPD